MAFLFAFLYKEQVFYQEGPMSVQDRFKCKCPRKLDSLPTEWCPLAVLRLKALRSSKKELSEADEAKQPGCPWAINDQMSGYCWFVYEAYNMPESPMSDVDIAAMLHVSTDTVKKTAERAMDKVRSTKEIKEIKDSFKDESIVEESLSLEDETVYCD